MIDEKSMNTKKLTSDSKKQSLSDENVTIDDWTTPDNQPPNEYGSGLMKFFNENSNNLWNLLRLKIQEKHSGIDEDRFDDEIVAIFGKLSGYNQFARIQRRKI